MAEVASEANVEWPLGVGRKAANCDLTGVVVMEVVVEVVVVVAW